LNIALLNKLGNCTLYSITDTGLSTFDAHHAEVHRAKVWRLRNYLLK